MPAAVAAATQAVLAVADVGFFVALAAVADTTRRSQAVAAVYAAAAAVFIVRAYQYHQFSLKVTAFRRVGVDDSLPLPVGSARPLVVSALYSALMVIVETIVACDVPPSTPAHAALLSMWALATVGYAVHACVNDDRHAIERHIQRVLIDAHVSGTAAPTRSAPPPTTTTETTVATDDDDDDESTEEELFETDSRRERARVYLTKKQKSNSPV